MSYLTEGTMCHESEAISRGHFMESHLMLAFIMLLNSTQGCVPVFMEI